MLKHDKKINGYQYTCRVCQETFILRGDLDRHMDSHWGQKRYSCDLCPKSFDGKRTLINHKLTHTKDRKRYPCDLCDKSFSLNEHLQTHRRRHTGEKPFSCEICQKSFTAYSTLYNHRKTHANKVMPSHTPDQSESSSDSKPAVLVFCNFVSVCGIFAAL